MREALRIKGMKKVFGVLGAGKTIHKLERKNTLLGKAPTSNIVLTVRSLTSHSQGPGISNDHGLISFDDSGEVATFKFVVPVFCLGI
jgi:hypothetical protein